MREVQELGDVELEESGMEQQKHQELRKWWGSEDRGLPRIERHGFVEIARCGIEDIAGQEDGERVANVEMKELPMRNGKSGTSAIVRIMV